MFQTRLTHSRITGPRVAGRWWRPAAGSNGSFSQTSVADMAMCQVCGALGFSPLTGTGNFVARQHMVGNCLFQG